MYSGACALKQFQIFKCNCLAGHYASDVYSVDDKCWKSFDDTMVTILQENDVFKLQQITGYIFFTFTNKASLSSC